MKLLSRASLLSLLFASLALSGCGYKAEKVSNVLRYPMTEEPASLDPPLVTSLDTGEMMQNVFEGLVIYDKDMKVSPWLADSWEISADKLTYTFHLNPRAKFHPPYNRLVTAADVKWSLERVLKPEMKAPLLTALFADIEGAKAVVDGKEKECSGVRIVDSNTIAITTIKPCSYMLQEFTSLTVFCKESVEKGGGKITAANCTGTGPFTLKEYRSGSGVTLAANPDYYRGRPKLDSIERPIVVDRLTEFAKYENGEIDICRQTYANYVMNRDSAKYKSQCVLMPLYGTAYIVMQPDVEPAFKDLRVRRAIAEAIDKDSMVRVVYHGAAKRALGFLPPGVVGHSDDIRAIPYDPDHARKLLAEAGHAGGAGMPRLTMQYPTNPELSSAVQLIRNNLRQNLGLDVELKEREAGSFYSDSGNNKIAFYIIGWNSADPHDFLTVQMRTGGKYNTVGYSSPKFDAVADKADLEFDPKKREALFREADQIELDDVAVIPTTYNMFPYLVSPRVKGLEYNLGGLLPHYRTSMTP